MRALRSEVEGTELEEGFADAFEVDWHSAGVDAAMAALLRYAEKLTRTPGEMTAADVETLRAAGWSDRAVLDAAQVIAYFNYINRLADGLGVDAEE